MGVLTGLIRRFIWHKLPCRLCLALGLCLFSCLNLLEAQVVQTSAGVFQAANRQGRAVVSYEEPHGLFLLLSPAVELQLFNLSDLPHQGSVHAFIKYSPELDRYVALYAGQREYRIKGNFTMWLELGGDRVRLAVDNNNPYLSLLFDGDSKERPASLLGFRGIDLVVNQTGQEHVALLEANQLLESSKYRGIIDHYHLKIDGLWLKGQKVNTPSIGIEVQPPRNVMCLKPNVVFVDERDIAHIRSLKRSDSLPKLEALLSVSPARDPLRGMLLLRIEESELVGLDYTSGAVKIIRPLSPEPKEEGPLACSVNVVELR